MVHDRAKVCVFVNAVVDLQVPFRVESYVELASFLQCSLFCGVWSKFCYAIDLQDILT